MKDLKKKRSQDLKDRVKNKDLNRRYGISLNTYNLLFEIQNGCCAICGISQSKLKKKLYVDHDHDTKDIRGLLCHKCNTGLGLMKDDALILKRAIDYLGKSKINLVI